MGSEDATAELGEFVEDEREPEPADEVIGEMESVSLKEAIERLPERHRYVLGKRYGLDDRNPASLAELGRELDISRERVRQLQRQAEHVLKSVQS